MENLESAYWRQKYIVINGEQQAIRMINDDTLEFVYDKSSGDYFRFKKAK